jgi:hypothetical protein
MRSINWHFRPIPKGWPENEEHWISVSNFPAASLRQNEDTALAAIGCSTTRI